MSLEIGVILICVASMFVTWLAFGRRLKGTKSARLMYWLKSSLFMALSIFVWILYKEPEIGFVRAVAIAAALGGFVSLVSSQWIFLFP
ncbi:hypothetical protein [Cupriavidus sp. HPC(L)]|uniref:hypothetical protein n=1 Tax=Cupriavidus sp. HPC(L) TaxID=1217418 RepID=UPI0012ED3E7E|nr:hypothetical protein [Cupriavidus sp. HPC(L)]